MVTHASVPQGYTHVTANTGLARAALPTRERWGGRVARGARSRRGGGGGSGGGPRPRLGLCGAQRLDRVVDGWSTAVVGGAWVCD